MTSPHLRLVVPAVILVSVLGACAPNPATPADDTGETARPTATLHSYPDPLPLSGDVDLVHDPSMIRASDGRYLLYSTGHNLQIRTSEDRTTFTAEGTVWPEGAPWTEEFTSPGDPDSLWAPDISHHGGKFYLYYSASSFGSRNSAIFLATSDTGLSGSWKNLARSGKRATPTTTTPSTRTSW